MPERLRTSFVLHETSRAHFWRGVGTLSIKTFRGGTAHYESGLARYAVDDHCYLVLNDGQPYSVTVDEPRPIESFCVFFAPDLAADAAWARAAGDERLLDRPRADPAPPRVFDRIYRHDALVTPALRTLRAVDQATEALDRSERFHAVLEALLVAQDRVAREPARLQALRAATREELYRRLHRARDYAAACCDGPVSLDDLAGVACLSPNHLLRTFRQLFGQSPHQWLTEVRLARARRLLEDGMPVTEVALAVGFESPSAFGRLFRRRVGSSPDAYRRKVISGERAAETPAQNRGRRFTREAAR